MFPYPFPNEVRVHPVIAREFRYRCARFKAGRNKAVFRTLIETASPIPTDQPHGKFLTFFHHLVSTYFGGHLMPKLTQLQKVRGKSRLPRTRLRNSTYQSAGHEKYSVA